MSEAKRVLEQAIRVENGKISAIRIYYDQIEVLTQLGLMPGAASG